MIGKGFSWAAFVAVVVLGGGALALLSCGAGGAGIAGIDSALEVEDGSVRVIKAERADSISPGGQTTPAHPGNEFLLVTVQVKGTVPLAGVTRQEHNLLKGAWALTDGGGARYSPGGLVGGLLVFEVQKPASGLVLWLGDQIQVPLGGFFGEEVAQATPPSSASATPGPALIPAETAPSPTETPLPSGPPAGAIFRGQFKGGTLEFTIGPDGASVLGGTFNIEGPLACTDGGTISDVQQERGFSTPIEDLAFDYVSPDAGGITFRGVFETGTSARGTLEMTLAIQGATCPIGSVDWTATAEEPGGPGLPAETAAPAVSAPAAGEWAATAEFGTFAFGVDEDGKVRPAFAFNFSAFECGGMSVNGLLGGWCESVEMVSAEEFEVKCSFPTFEMSILGRFDPSGKQATGTWQAKVGETACSGPWQAEAGRRPAETETAATASPIETPAPVGPVTPRAGPWSGPSASFVVTADGLIQGLALSFFFQGTYCSLDASEDIPAAGGTFEYEVQGPPELFGKEWVAATFAGSFADETTMSGTYSVSMCGNQFVSPPAEGEWTATWQGAAPAVPSAPAPPAAGLPEPPSTFACPSPRVNDFSSMGGFRTGNVSWGRWGMSSGEYYFALKQPDSWGWVSDGIKTADAIFEADARQSADGPGVYGLAFGGNNLTDGQQVHAFVIDRQGQYALFRHTQAGDWVEVQPFTYSFLLNQGGQTNHLRVVRSGPLIALYANGFPLGLTALYDASYTGARYAGFLAWSNEAAGLEARFDNYTVCPLTEPYPMPVSPFAEKTVRWPAGQPVVLNWAWFATTGELASAFAGLSDISLTVDGQTFSGLGEYWGAPSPYASGYGVQWNLPLPPLEPGVHRIEADLRLAEQITDGFDENQDGKRDLYGPGLVVTGWVELQVEP